MSFQTLYSIKILSGLILLGYILSSLILLGLILSGVPDRVGNLLKYALAQALSGFLLRFVYACFFNLLTFSMTLLN